MKALKGYTILKKSDISNLQDGDPVIIDGYLEKVPTVFYINRKLDKMTLQLNSDDNIYHVYIFNRGFLKNKLQVGSKVTVVGKFDKKRMSITATDLYFGSLEKTRIEPIYHTTYGITGKQIHKYVMKALEKEFKVIDYLPYALHWIIA